MFFFSRTRVAYRISSSEVASSTETAWTMDESEGADLSSFIYSISALTGNLK